MWCENMWRTAPVSTCCQTAADCDDNSICTTDTCVNNACVHTAANNGVTCLID